MTSKTLPLPSKSSLLDKITKKLHAIDEAVNYDPIIHIHERIHLLETRLKQLEEKPLK